MDGTALGVVKDFRKFAGKELIKIQDPRTKSQGEITKILIGGLVLLFWFFRRSKYCEKEVLL